MNAVKLIRNGLNFNGQNCLGRDPEALGVAFKNQLTICGVDRAGFLVWLHYACGPASR